MMYQKSMFAKMVEKNPDKYPAKMGQPWTKEETEQLLKSIQENKSVKIIATEHERTVGAITSRQKLLAIEYYTIEKKSIEDIEKLTGLSKSQIEFTIKKQGLHSAVKEHNELTKKKIKKFIIKKETDKEVVESSDMKQIIELLKDIQSKLAILIEKTA